MPKQFSDTIRRDFSSRPASNYGHAGYDDPSIIEEAENLLSQFMRHPSHRSRTSQVERCSSLQRHISTPNTPVPFSGGDLDSVNNWSHTVPEDATLEISPKKHDALIQRSATNHLQTRHNHWFKNPQGPANSESSREKVMRNHDCAVAIPTNGKRKSYGNESVESSATGQNMSKMAGRRRSGRPKSGPANYHVPIHLHGVDSEEESECNTVKSSMNTESPSQRCKPDILSPDMQNCVIYSSPEVQIIKSRFKKVTDLKGLEHASYSPERNPAYYVPKKFVENAEIILHVDFDEEEMLSVINLLSLCGLRWTPCSEIALSDQIIQAISNFNIPDGFSMTISRMRKLSRTLKNEGVTDKNAWILKLLTTYPDPDKKELRHARSRVIKILGQREWMSNGQHGYQMDEIHRLGACLPYASILSRRHSKDVDAFLRDARSGCLPSVPCIVKAIFTNSNCLSTGRRLSQSSTLNRLLQYRELGCSVNKEISSGVTNNFKLSKTWKGASNDVMALAWSPDGTKFAAGATAQCDRHNMEYNRGNNLVLGDLTQNSLEELPDHYISRPERRGASGIRNNARLFMTVTAVRWFDDVLLTGSYDRTVKLWEFANGRASCYKTLHHDTKVLVMARSNFEQNVLATGTRSIGLWNMKESEYTPLGINKHRSRKDIKLVPTSLAWGTVPSTKDILVAGMSEKDDGVSQNGLLAAWQVREGGATPLQLSPNSQNIFDIRWHPSSEAFVTGSSTGQKKNGSVVRQYEPLKSKTRIYEFDCPAMDINDVTFCPINSNYVTANCTDGNTYVWDYRKHNDFILKLPHGDPLNQTDERLTREQADVGVTVALWGNAIDQFYTGASDGILKRWNILRSSEDALVEDTHSFKEEIARAAFSDDKSNLLVGDAAGGIHVLSPGPFSNTDDLSFTFKRAPQLPFDHHEPDSESGVKAARKLLSSGQLVQHPVFGAGQGPRYSGPFATWARPEGTPFDQIAKTQLKRELQIRQLDWIPVQSRDVLDEQSRREVEAQIQLARIRNQRQNEYKRKRAEPSNTKALASFDDNFIDLCSDEDAKPCPSAVFHSGFKRRAKTQSCGSLVIDVQPEIIDLTGDTDTEEFADPSTDAQLQGVTRCPEPNKVPLRGGDTLLQELEEELDEDFWWPSSRYVDPNIQDVTV